VAVTLAALNAERIDLADEPVYPDATWVSNYRIDPFVIPTDEKVALLGEYSARLLASESL
jgi:TldD protein